MRFLPILLSLTLASAFKYDRLNRNDTALLIVDTQVGLFHIVRDQTPTEYRNNMLAHAAIGKLFNLPVIMTTSAQNGPNGPLPKEILEMHPEAPLIERNGEVNAWDNKDFRDAVKKTGKKQLVVAGITTDVCTAFLSLSLREAGYEVWANTDASGTFSDKIAADANVRMRDAGVHITSMFAVVCELMRDWRSQKGEVLQYFDKYLPAYGYLARHHGYAVESGELVPGEKELL